jgi:hypothetical protein
MLHQPCPSLHSLKVSPGWKLQGCARFAAQIPHIPAIITLDQV